MSGTYSKSYNHRAVLLIAAVAILGYGLLTRFRDFGPAAWLTVIVRGIIILIATPFFGPMPRAAETAVQSGLQRFG